MNKYIIIEVGLFISGLLTVFIFFVGLFIAFYLNNANLGFISFGIFLSLAAIIFFCANILESLGLNK